MTTPEPYRPTGNAATASAATTTSRQRFVIAVVAVALIALCAGCHGPFRGPGKIGPPHH